jgi:hypothetical protein
LALPTVAQTVEAQTALMTLNPQHDDSGSPNTHAHNAAAASLPCVPRSITRLETRQRVVDMVANNIESFAAGEPLNIVN